MHVVATAGHVDHGKSSLVRRLTGQDPDRLAEEKRRGLSIRLGYCWCRLGDAGDVGDVALVDVPGHERFIDTTLAGLGPAPVVLFVVAADDPWMPQAAEHLAALDALGVDRGLLVVTRADLADPTPALAEARAALAATSLAGIDDVIVSSRTGEGFDALRAALARLLAATPAPDPAADVRLWIDRQFHVKGTGTVVTGTLSAGTIRVGDRLLLGEQAVRVRGIECLQQQVEAASGVARVALSLGGARATPDGHREPGLVTPDAYDAVRVVDVRRTPGDGVPERPLLHAGATSQEVHVRPLGDEHLRLTLTRPLPLRIGDRLILRDPGSRRLWGARVLDADPKPLRRRGAAAARAAALGHLDGSLATHLALAGHTTRGRLRRLGLAHEPVPPSTVQAGDHLLDGSAVADLTARLERAVADSDDGLTPVRAAHLLDLPAELVTSLVAPPVHLSDGRLRVTTAAAEPPEHPALAALRADLAATPYAAPDAQRLSDLGLDDTTLVRLHRDGALLRLAERLVLLPGADREAAALLADLPQPFTTSEARQRLGTSRRVALPLLTHLDKAGLTVRLPDDRRRMRGTVA